MLYFSDNELDDFLLEDIYRGDLTTHALGLESIPAKICFKRKKCRHRRGYQYCGKTAQKTRHPPTSVCERRRICRSRKLIIKRQRQC
ncbi:pyrophosphorylase ModD [Pasteurella multocida]|nr:pyrophosphorylase ModD [Pasteurella multocida]